MSDTTKPSRAKLTAWLAKTSVTGDVTDDQDGGWARINRDPLPGAGEWSHQYGRTDNSAFGGEALLGATNTDRFDLQWVGRPGPRFKPERNGRKPAPLSTGGRLFIQGLRRIAALDAYNGTVLTNFWGGSGAGWYDATRGAATFKVCSDNLFAVDKKSGKQNWDYTNGAIINSTITIGGGRVYFVETRNAVTVGASERRLGSAEFWKDQFLIALDTNSGEKLWEQPIDTADGVVMFCLAYGQQRLALVSSGKNEYSVYTFDATTGKPAWDTAFRWRSNNHGGHMSRPAIDLPGTGSAPTAGSAPSPPPAWSSARKAAAVAAAATGWKPPSVSSPSRCRRSQSAIPRCAESSVVVRSPDRNTSMP